MNIRRNLLLLALTLTAALNCKAQLNGTGFYRFRNAQQGDDYISLSNDKLNFKVVIDDAAGGFTNLATDNEARKRALACASLYMQTDIHLVEDEDCIDPSTIIYANKKNTNSSDYDYNLIGQGTSILTLTTGTVSHPNSFLSPSITFSNIYVNIRKSSGSGAESLYTAYIELKGSLKYLGTSTESLGDRYFTDVVTDKGNIFDIAENNSATNAKWYIEPVTHFNVKPEVEYGGKYYTTLYVPFAFELSNGVEKAYVVSAINTDGTLEIVEYANGATVPAGTPVILECSSNVSSDCQLIPLGTPLFTAPENVTNAYAPTASTATNYSGTNLLKGNYFCNQDGTITFTTSSSTGTFNANHFTSLTSPQKYVLGLTASGKLGFVKATADNVGTAMPANKAWLEYTGSAELILPIENSTLKGDVNHDGKVDVADVTTLVDYILGNTPQGFDASNCNVNEDTKIDVGDVTSLVDIILNSN